MIPSISQIVTAARVSSSSSPRPSRAFWLAACRSIVEPDVETTANGHVAIAFCVEHNLPFAIDGARRFADAQATAIKRLSLMGEAALRAAFVELSILASPNEDDARAMWAEALGMDTEAAR